jgi:serine phosphatase RsbU (regulator of sigma subunit)
MGFRLKDVKIGIRLTIWFFLIALMSSAVIGYIAYSNAKNSLENQSFEKLTAVREMKATQIEDYFIHINDQIISFSHNPTVVKAVEEFKRGFNELPFDYFGDSLKRDHKLKKFYDEFFIPELEKNAADHYSYDKLHPNHVSSLILQDLFISSNPHPLGEKDKLDSPGDESTYSEVHQSYHPFIRSFQQKFGYYDIFLVDDRTGNVLYSVFKEVDFGTSLVDGPHKNSGLAKVFKKTRSSGNAEEVVLVDYESYIPSYNAPAAFIASPIYDGLEKVGILIFQMPINKINNIMTSNQKWKDVGLGESGETYIVGSDHLLRNQSRFLIEDSTNYFKMISEIGTPKDVVNQIKSFHSSIGLQEVKTEGTESALKGKTDHKIFKDYRGVKVLSAYKPLNIKGLNWVIMSEIDEAEAFAPVRKLRNYILYIFGGILIFILALSYFVSGRITKPLKHLKGGAKQLAKGNMDAEINIQGKDEIGVLALSFKKMQHSIKKLVSDLQDMNQNLEKKVEERTFEIQLQKEQLEAKNDEIMDSINYAQRLQTAILPSKTLMDLHLPEYFVLFKPKDVVSGDFYWMDFRQDSVIAAAVDCTGHGVPGAMVSVVGANGLKRCVNEFKLSHPGDILHNLTDTVIETFETENHEVKDGMDIALIHLHKKSRVLEYAGAHNPLWYIRDGELHEIKANKQPIGKFDHRSDFVNHELQLMEGDCVYIFTDGYADQFGGEKGKKLKSSNFKRLLLEIWRLPMSEQKEKLDMTIENWRGDIEQLDDICVIGIRV